MEFSRTICSDTSPEHSKRMRILRLDQILKRQAERYTDLDQDMVTGFVVVGGGGDFKRLELAGNKDWSHE